MKESLMTNILIKTIQLLITISILLIMNRSLIQSAIILVLTLFVIFCFKYYLNNQFSIADLDITGINNKATLERYIKNIQKKSLPDNIGIIVLDLNNLKFVNDKYGHKTGDLYIEKFANCIMRIVSDNCFVARFGGDEFVIILNNTSNDEMHKLMDQLEYLVKYQNANFVFPISYAIGYAFNDNTEYNSIDDMFDKADKMMYEDKAEKKRCSYCINNSPAISEETLNSKIGVLLEKIKNNEKKYCFAMLDINNFYFINGDYGFEEGNKLLSQTLEKFMNFEYTHFIYRLHADLFAIAFDISKVKKEVFFERLNPLLVRNINNKSDEIIAKYNMGLYFPTSLDTSESVIYNCNIARITSKEKTQALCVYKEEYSEKIRLKNEILSSFYQGLAENEFKIYIQPKINVLTKKITGIEVLARWHDGEKIRFYPDSFIPILEQSGDIIELDFYIYEETFKWISEKNPNIPISLNVSPIHFNNPKEFSTRILNLIKEYDIAANQIIFEITEYAFINNTKQVDDVIRVLKKHGIRISMDDFGSGYSSLNSLKSLCFDEVKLDKAFFKGNLDNDSIIVIQEILHMLKRLNKHIVCEGVETKEISDFLSAEGCDEMQGYYYFKPMPLQQFERMLFLPLPKYNQKLVS